METALKEEGGATDIKLDEILEAAATPPCYCTPTSSSPSYHQLTIKTTHNRCTHYTGAPRTPGMPADLSLKNSKPLNSLKSLNCIKLPEVYNYINMQCAHNNKIL